MATGHIQPGYGDIVSKLRRAKSAGYPLDRQTLYKFSAKDDVHEMKVALLQLQAETKRVWSEKSYERTTYNCAYKPPNYIEQVSPRPASPERLNNPHPPQVFLINRLHYIPGYGNPDASLGKRPYRVDASVSPEEQQRRRESRAKFAPTTSAAALNQYSDPEGVRQTFGDPMSRAAAEAYLKVADTDRARGGVYHAVNNFMTTTQRQVSDSAAGNRPKTALPSIHRWNKFSGQLETANLQGIQARDVYHQQEEQMMPSSFMRPPSTTGDARREEIENYRQYRVDPTRRGDFLIHPNWPPSLPHHRLG